MLCNTGYKVKYCQFSHILCTYGFSISMRYHFYLICIFFDALGTYIWALLACRTKKAIVFNIRQGALINAVARFGERRELGFFVRFVNRKWKSKKLAESV